jgi:CheY-like chemotaxis protein
VREAASIAEVIRESTSFVLRGSKVRCEIHLDPELWVVEIDAGQISQVLHNLLLNASQAMPNGGKVEVVGSNVADPPRPLAAGDYVRIDVIDHGVGIAEDHRAQIFDPYFTTKEEGRGLGLASAYAIVKKHDGLLTVRSEQGKGTTFSIFLPRTLSDTAARAVLRQDGPLRFDDCRVLLMDDDRAVRRTAGAMLERVGCVVTHAQHGAEALSLYEDAFDAGTPFDVVVMDLTVPGGMGGQDAVARLRALDPEALAIVYSGYSTDPVLANFRDYGFDGRLSKPFRIKELASVLADVLGQRDKLRKA